MAVCCRYHCECLNPPLQEIPVEEWFCPDCAQTETGMKHNNMCVIFHFGTALFKGRVEDGCVYQKISSEIKFYFERM